MKSTVRMHMIQNNLRTPQLAGVISLIQYWYTCKIVILPSKMAMADNDVYDLNSHLNMIK